MVEDYEKRGSRLIEELEKAHEVDHEDYKTRTNEVRTKLANTLSVAEHDLTTKMKEIKKNSITGAMNRWKVDHQQVHDQLDSALLAIGE